MCKTVASKAAYLLRINCPSESVHQSVQSLVVQRHNTDDDSTVTIFNTVNIQKVIVVAFISHTKLDDIGTLEYLVPNCVYPVYTDCS